MPDSTMRMSSSEIRRRQHQKLDALTGYLVLLHRPDVFDSLCTREKAKEAVHCLYEEMGKGMILDDMLSGETLVPLDSSAVRVMKRTDPGMNFLDCLQARRYDEARRRVPELITLLEQQIVIQKDYVRTLDTGKA